MYPAQEAVPIVRIMGKLSSIGRVIYNESEQGVRNPEGIWVWLVKKKRPQSVGGVGGIANLEIYSYIRDYSIVKTSSWRMLLRDIVKP